MKSRSRMIRVHERRKNKSTKKVKGKSTRKEKSNKTEEKKRISPKKIFFYTLGVCLAGGAGFLVYDKVIKPKLHAKDDSHDDDANTIIVNNNLPSSGSSTSSSGSFFRSFVSHSDEFPLKRGSRGLKVTQLQQALAKIIGTAAMNANGGIDGQFGPGTANALKAAGYPETVDEAIFNKITGGNTVNIVFNPQDLAQRLYNAADAKDADAVLGILKQLKSPAEYSAVNEYFRKKGFISKTIVTDLLDIAFKGNDIAREEIKAELKRIGLKMDDSGRWSLSGFEPKDLITLRATVVTDSRNRKIPVGRNVILGDQLATANGMAWFRSVDNEILKVPAQDVRRS